MSTPAQVAANQANSQHSTGPQTETGKAASARNSFRHGLSGAFVLLAWENSSHYDQLLAGLRHEHQPATPTEALLVERMAQHWWLGQRALHLQQFCFHDTAPMLSEDGDKELALYLRYQATHDRAFHKCLNDLHKMRAEQLKAAHRIERLALSAHAQQAAEARKTELHQAKLEMLQPKSQPKEAQPASAPATTAAPVSHASVSRLGPDFEAKVRATFALDAQQEAELQAFLNQHKAA